MSSVVFPGSETSASNRLRPAASRPIHVSTVRPTVRGKYLTIGHDPFYVRGVSYGAFRPDAQKEEYTNFSMIERDFADMAAANINTVRIPHTMPPRHLLDLAAAHGLRVMVGLSAEQYVGYLIDRAQAPDIGALVRNKVRLVAGHPALLCYALGNEISATLTRWLGPRQIERYLFRLHEVVRQEDPAGLITYVNYPTTEYLRLPFLDFLSFNVYLESRDRLEAYVARLQNIADHRPLLLSELGLDALRNGRQQQADTLDWQIRSAFAEGCCGTVVFSWTDEWYRAGEDVTDWGFGLTDGARRPKPALQTVSAAYRELPFQTSAKWPSVSVVVCTYNGSRTIRDCLDSLRGLAYPNFEVIVVNDGSTDATAEIVDQYPEVRLITTANQGLSAARNTGLAASRARIVAYLDDDAAPDRHWLSFVATAFLKHGHAAVGGPNIAPPGHGLVAACVNASPGGPTHVLLTDREAEHIPGCNMAFDRERLIEIGGFDPTFRIAGDDVDVCWRVTDQGWTIGYSAGAVVWHRRRDSVRAFWKQQRGYGRAESLLEAKWPQKYNSAGHLTWTGRVYGAGSLRSLRLFSRPRVYYGVWGQAPFQPLHEPASGIVGSIPLMPEWYLVLFALAALSGLGAVWSPLMLAWPLFAGSVAATLLNAVTSAHAERHQLRRVMGKASPAAFALTAVLHLVQPLARLAGRLEHGLTPWRKRGAAARLGPLWPHSRAVLHHGAWEPVEQTLSTIERSLRTAGAVVRRGGPYDRWDLHVYGGLLGGARALIAVEDHGSVLQLIRLRMWPTVAWPVLVVLAAVTALALAALRDDEPLAAILLSLGALLLLGRQVQEMLRASGSLRSAVARQFGPRGAAADPVQ